MPTTLTIGCLGLGVVDKFNSSPRPMQQALLIWRACTANDPIQIDADDIAASAPSDSTVLTAIMPASQPSITPVTTLYNYEPLGTQLEDPKGKATAHAVTPVKVIADYPPSEGILQEFETSTASPVIDTTSAIKPTHYRSESSSSTSSTTTIASTDSVQSATSEWSNSTSSTSISESTVSDCKVTSTSPKDCEMIASVAVDGGLQCFAMTISHTPPVVPIVIVTSPEGVITIVHDHSQGQPIEQSTSINHREPIEHHSEAIEEPRPIDQDSHSNFTWKFDLPIDELEDLSFGSPKSQSELDSDRETVSGNISLSTLAPFAEEIEIARQSQTARDHDQLETYTETSLVSTSFDAIPVREADDLASKKFKVRCSRKVAASSPCHRKFRIGGNQSSPVRPVPQIIVTSPADIIPSEKDNGEYPEDDVHEDSKFLAVPGRSQTKYDTLPRNLATQLVPEFSATEANFAPSSPAQKEEWLNKWAEKRCLTKVRATRRTIDTSAAKEKMRVENDKVFLPPITTETPRARQIDTFAEDWVSRTPEPAVSSLDKWSEDQDEGFDDLFGEEHEALDGVDGGTRENGNSTTDSSTSDTRYTITHHFDDLFDWKNEGKAVKGQDLNVGGKKRQDDESSNVKCTGKVTLTTRTQSSKEHDKQLDKSALVSAMCQKWGPDRFDRWCEEYATPISETIWDEDCTGLEEYCKPQSEPAPMEDQVGIEVTSTPRRHSLPCEKPSRRYLRTRRSLGLGQRKDDVLTGQHLRHSELQRWAEERDPMKYDQDFVLDCDDRE
ncbi:hypothetical protein GE21DRAFT_44 [Neurospora crassa]|uniref:Uncharacterized protein n=1 Tax=Neurospora crassa (strain ATCC 24698 / 74-OR23-1A / CBS 708.71 / DSM 1257 / FGSC 987) TaxID=367110 RepID=Q7SGK9_NEUCR|nr:hypothetical protein NCU08075 [Neurospora crassa OR74A]EAA35970.1 hypothetical protein NCU08075 [Neurospora crassa OR74A]KHE80659.1 hypothetical protein GE21DRAFT_44 [Neurospora crassa]|eukprot:XP_965206.1 hypothetical protein NCU08075 [Neurospora crassa OR74A]